VLMGVPIAALLRRGVAPLGGDRTREGGSRPCRPHRSSRRTCPYLGNHLAFIERRRLPKPRRPSALLTNANIDWGRNDEKIARAGSRRGDSRGRLVPIPIHVRRGETSSSSTTSRAGPVRPAPMACGEHGLARAHLVTRTCVLETTPATYERMIEESRHLRPSTVDARLCAGRTRGSARGRRRRLAARPGTDGRTDPLRDDAVARSTSADRGSGIGGAGPGGQPLREQSQLGRGQQSWYRFEPARARWPRSPRAAARALGAAGRPATLALRRVPVERGLIAEEPSVLRDLVRAARCGPRARPCAGSAWPARRPPGPRPSRSRP
jgi:hypothetical protein